MLCSYHLPAAGRSGLTRPAPSMDRRYRVLDLGRCVRATEGPETDSRAAISSTQEASDAGEISSSTPAERVRVVVVPATSARTGGSRRTIVRTAASTRGCGRNARRVIVGPN